MNRLISLILTLAGLALMITGIGVLDLLGYRQTSEMLGASRWMLFPAGIALFLISGVIDNRTRKQALTNSWSEFATRHGGQLATGRWVAPKMSGISFKSVPLGGGLPSGVSVAVTVGSQRMVLDAVRHESYVTTRLGGPICLTKEMNVFVIPQNGAVKLLTSPMVASFIRMQLPKPGPSADASMVRAEAELLLFGDAIATSDPAFDKEFVLRSDDPARARELLDDSSFRQTFLDLRSGGKQFSWGIARNPDGSGQRIEFAEPFLVLDADRLNKIHELQVRALDSLNRMGILREGEAAA